MTNLQAAILVLCLVIPGLGEDADRKVEDWTGPEKIVCEVHGEKLTKVEVPILWGLPATQHSLSEQIRLFPYSQTIAYGGCVVTDGEGKRKRAYIHQCRSCITGFHQWLAKNYPLPAHRRPIAPRANAIYQRLLEEFAEQAGAGQPATRPESDSEGGNKLQPEAEERPR